MDESKNDVVVPVVQEEVHADAVPVVTGGVRVTKRTGSHDEIVEQELSKSHVQVKRVKTDRVVDGPQPVQRVGNTLIVPVVSEVLRVEKQWMVTEEIHITELRESETVQQKVTLQNEEAEVAHLDREGKVIAASDESEGIVKRPSAPRTLLDDASRPIEKKRKVLSRSRNILKDPQNQSDS